MASLNIRPTQIRAVNSENEGVMAGKAGVGGLKARPLRGAMQEIGGNLTNLPSQGVGQVPLKPTRANIPLKSKNVEIPTRILPKRKSTEKSSKVEKMETSLSEELKADDIEMEDIEAVPTEVIPASFSKARLLPEFVEDIDKDDFSDPQLVSEYVNQIYLYLRQLERDQAVEKGYLDGSKGGAILPKMRGILIDWLVEVHQQFSMLQETMYMAVAILDRFLQKAAPTITRKSLQLVGVTAMFIASKYEEMYAPEINDFVYITDNAYTQAQIRQMEVEILRVLNFDLGRPLPLHFLRRNSKAGCVEARVHTLAKYILELTLVEYDLMAVEPSRLAAAALVISMKFFDDEDDLKNLSDYWTPTLNYYTMYSWEELSPTVDALLKMVHKVSSAKPDAKLMSIRTKYMNRKFGKIAHIAQVKLHYFERMRPELFSS